MKRFVSLILALLCAGALLVSCSANAVDISGAETLTDLTGARIAAQAQTFHAKALSQISDVRSSTYPDFTDLLTALKSRAIDGYIAEEPTALAVCLQDDTLGYLKLKNNDTGFTATDADVGIAVGLREGDPLRGQINQVLATISAETRAALMEQMVRLAAGESVDELVLDSQTGDGAFNGVFRVAMECAYKPFNWTETKNPTVGAVPISGEGKEGLYANGYDVQIARYICSQLGYKLEIYAMDWDSLVPALNANIADAIIAGMSPTADREKEIDFTDVYYSSNLVIIYNK